MKALIMFVAAVLFISSVSFAGENATVSTADAGSGGVAGTAGQGGIFAPAAVLKKGAFVIGAEPVLYFDGPKKFGVLGHIRYGLMPRFELNGTFGINRGEVLFRGGVDYQAIYDQKGSIGVLVRAGGFMNTDGMGSGIDAGVMVGNQFKLVNIYGGFDMKFIVDPANVTVANLVGGIHIPFEKKVAFTGEVGLNINDKHASYLSGGVLFYF